MSGAVAVVILDDRGDALLVREGGRRQRWRLPGGQVREGEDPTQTACREAREELGVDVELERLIAFYELHGDLNGLRFVFAGRVPDGQEPVLPRTDDIGDLAWFSPDALPEPLTAVAPWGVADATAGHAGVIRRIEVRQDRTIAS